MTLSPSALNYTLGEPVDLPVIRVVNKLSHFLTLMSVNESQKHTAVQKKKKRHCLRLLPRDTICTQFTNTQFYKLLRDTYTLGLYKELKGNKITKVTAVVPFIARKGEVCAHGGIHWGLNHIAIVLFF